MADTYLTACECYFPIDLFYNNVHRRQITIACAGAADVKQTTVIAASQTAARQYSSLVAANRNNATYRKIYSL